MTMTPENANTWRDIAEQLTPAQTDELLREHAAVGASLSDTSWVQDRERELLALARRYARTNLLNALIGPVPAAAGARVDTDWEDDESAIAHRFVSGAEREIAGFALFASACQFADGSIDLGRIEAPSVTIAEKRVSVEDVRVLIAALQECLDEIDRWTDGSRAT